MRTITSRAVAGGAIGLLVAGAAACGSSGSSGNSGQSSTSTPPSTSASLPSISASSFTVDFSAMNQLQSLASQGKGKVGVLLPETTTSARYTQFDAPYLKQALQAAGLSSGDFKITNAQGSDATQKTQAEADMTAGATVLILDPHTPGGGAAIESEAKSRGVKVIDYDRLTTGGSRDYYVSFNNVQVGKLIGQGLVSCIATWKVKNPHVLVMRGDPTDNNAAQFAQGYNGVLASYFSSNKYVKVGEPAGTWDPPTAQTTFQQQYTAHKDINAVVTPNDDNANAIISYLKTLKIKPQTFPTTGQDASLAGLQNILAGYQCGTVYKPIYKEAQAAVALALYLRAGASPPSTLVNAQTTDPTSHTQVPSVLLTPTWVTTANMASTVVADKATTTSQLCAGSFASLCSKYNIS